MADAWDDLYRPASQGGYGEGVEVRCVHERLAGQLDQLVLSDRQQDESLTHFRFAPAM
jgi:hypothetical protein